MKSHQSLLIGLLGVVSVSSLLFSPLISVGETSPSIEEIAKITTVLIAEGLNQGDVEKKQEDWNAGSGVIIGRQGRKYYVLTAFHVIPSSERQYGIRTYDGKVYCFGNQHQDLCVIHPLGKRRSDKTIEGFDLAIVEFQSDTNYPVATLGHSEELQEKKDNVIVSGWPRPASQGFIREWKAEDGHLVLKASQADVNGGYSLLYDNTTEVGMSGGPVFNGQGQVVGIHGRGRAKGNTYCIDPQLSVNNSCGMQMIHFIDTSEGKAIQSAFNLNPIDPQSIAQALKKSGPSRVDLREIFTFGSMIRDEPSTGCNFSTIGCEY